MFFIKLIISLSLLYFTIKDIEYKKLNIIFSNLDIFYIILAVFIQFFLTLLLTFRWHKVALFLRLDLSFFNAWNNVLIGSFFNQTLPSSIGGDAIRILLLSKFGYKLAFKAIVIDRFFALCASIFMCISGYFVLSIEIIENSFYFYSLFLIPLLILLSIFCAIIIESFSYLIKIRFIFERLGVTSLFKTLKLVLYKTQLSVFTFLYSIIIQLVVVFSGLLILKSMNISVDNFDFAILFISVLLISIIPISIAGWGVRENLMVVMLSGIGLNEETSLSLSIIFGLIMLFAGLPGGILLLNKKIASEIRLFDFFKKN